MMVAKMPTFDQLALANKYIHHRNLHTSSWSKFVATSETDKKDFLTCNLLRRNYGDLEFYDQNVQELRQTTTTTTMTTKTTTTTTTTTCITLLNAS